MDAERGGIIPSRTSWFGFTVLERFLIAPLACSERSRARRENCRRDSIPVAEFNRSHWNKTNCKKLLPLGFLD